MIEQKSPPIIDPKVVPQWAIWIPGNVPSLKNGKQIVGRGKFPRLIPSKAHAGYEKDTFLHYKDNKELFHKMIEGMDRPIAVKYYIVRKSKHRWDWTNAIDTAQDLIVKHGWVEDDSADIIYPQPVGWKYDKMNPGIFIWA